MNTCFEVGNIGGKKGFWILGWKDRQNYLKKPHDIGPIGPFQSFDDAQKFLFILIRETEELTGTKARMTDYRDISKDKDRAGMH